MNITLEMILTNFFNEHPEADTGYKKNEHPLLGIHLLPKHPDTLTPDYLYISDCYNEKYLTEIPSSISVICLLPD